MRMNKKSVTVTDLLEELSLSRKSRTPSWKAVVAYLLKKKGLLCALCERGFIEVGEISIDHIIPRSSGGADRLRNFQLAHRVCNVRRGPGVPNDYSQYTRLQVTGIIPLDVQPGTDEYKELYREVRDDMDVLWWQHHRRQLVGLGRRFSYVEWPRIQDAVYKHVWRLRVRCGLKAALDYEPTREEYTRKRQAQGRRKEWE